MLYIHTVIYFYLSFTTLFYTLHMRVLAIKTQL